MTNNVMALGMAFLYTVVMTIMLGSLGILTPGLWGSGVLGWYAVFVLSGLIVMTVLTLGFPRIFGKNGPRMVTENPELRFVRRFPVTAGLGLISVTLFVQWIGVCLGQNAYNQGVSWHGWSWPFAGFLVVLLIMHGFAFTYVFVDSSMTQGPVSLQGGQDVH